MLCSSEKTLLVRDDEKVFCNTLQDSLECCKLEVQVYHISAEGTHPNRPEGWS